MLLCAAAALLLAATTLAQAPAQHADVIFQSLERENGLPSPIVQALAQDGHGFIWVGTGSGVSRWDGYRFRNYTEQIGVPGALPDNDVYSMYTDPAGTVWIGTQGRGVARYDSAHDDFDTFVPAGKEKTYATVYAIQTDGAGGLFLGTRVGIDHLDPATGAFTHVELEGAKGPVRVLSLKRDRQGQVLAGTGQGLFRSDREGKHFTHVDVFAGAKVAIWRLFFDREGRLWIGTIAGAFVLQPSAQQAQRIRETNGPSSLDQEAVDDICEASPGVIWLGTLGQGIVAVDAKTLETHRIVHDAAYPTSLPNDQVVKLLTDKAGSVWVGTANGVGRTSPAGGILTFFGATGVAGQAGRIADPGVTYVVPMQDGLLWLGLNGNGAQLVRLHGATIEPIRQIPAGVKAPLPAGQTNTLSVAPDGSLYIGTANWVYRADRDGRNLAALPRPPAGQAVRVDALLYNSGTLWIGAHNGLWSEDFSKGPAERSAPLRIELPLKSPEITLLGRGVGNDLWIGTSSDLVRYDMASHAVERIPVNPDDPHALPAQPTSFLLDRQHRIWVTTWGGGVCLLEGRDAQGNETIRSFANGLPNANTDDLLQAADGKFWISTDDGFAVMDPETFTITPLSQADGVAIPAYWVKSGANTADGRLLFGGDGGLTVVDPASIKSSGTAAPVVVTDILAGGKPEPFDVFNDGAASPALQIHHDGNSVAVEFASLDYTGSDRELYAYKLDGFDKDWIHTPSTRRVASYTNLPPGSYTLELRGSNRDGLWGAVRTLRITVVPAWYQTLWARIAGLLLFLLILTAVYRARTAYHRTQRQELERRVDLRTAELKKLTEELQESRHRLEEMAHTDALTGLPNRRMFSESLRRLMAASRRNENRPFTLMVFDLDKFKDINDNYGHDAGDAWLQVVAQRVGSVLRESDCFARVGGDEFSILIADAIDTDGIATLCRALASSVQDPLVVNGAVLNTTLSIGVASFPADGEEETTLFKAADIALYRAKRSGGNGWRQYADAGETASEVAGTSSC